MTPETELLLFEASRSQLVREVIKPALERGMCVIADRFSDSTTVYQGAARELERKMIERVNAFVVGDCVPNITFVLDVDAAAAYLGVESSFVLNLVERDAIPFFVMTEGDSDNRSSYYFRRDELDEWTVG